jgi:hypothetical protein
MSRKWRDYDAYMGDSRFVISNPAKPLNTCEAVSRFIVWRACGGWLYEPQMDEMEKAVCEIVRKDFGFREKFSIQVSEFYGCNPLGILTFIARDSDLSLYGRILHGSGG